MKIKEFFQPDKARAEALRLAKQAGRFYEIAAAKGGEAVTRRGEGRPKPNPQKYRGGRFARQVLRRKERMKKKGAKKA